MKLQGAVTDMYSQILMNMTHVQDVRDRRAVVISETDLSLRTPLEMGLNLQEESVACPECFINVLC